MTTTLTKEQIRKLVEWMQDRSVATDVVSQARTYGKQLLEDFGETHVREMATIDGMVLTNEHLGVSNLPNARSATKPTRGVTQ